MKILFINACVRSNSRTLELANAVLKFLDGEVTEIDLDQETILPLTASSLASRDAVLRAGKLDDPSLRHARQFASADLIVLAAPYWDLSFPAAVKSYLEAVTVTGVTFRYTPEGFPEGLCKATRLIYVTTSGGPIMNYNLGYDYVKALSLLYYGIPEVQCIKAENLDIDGADVAGILQSAKETIPQILTPITPNS